MLIDDLISIIVPVYNVEKYLRKCLDSIINQTYKNLEIILVDDGSPDNCGKICDEYAEKDKRVKVIHKENGGVSSARNVGLENATGDYIGFVDSDDWIEPEMYEMMIKKIKQYGVDMIRCSYVKEGTNNDIVNHAIKSEGVINLVNERDSIINYLIIGSLNAYLWIALIKRDFALSISKFNENVGMREDVIWMIELICSVNTMYYLPKEYYHYFQNFDGACKSLQNKKRNILDMITVYESVKNILIKKNLYNEEIKDSLSFWLFFKISTQLSTYLSYSKDKAVVNECLNNIIFVDMVKSVNLRRLSIVNKIIVELIIKKKTILLYYFMLLRQNVRKKVIRGVDYD